MSFDLLLGLLGIAAGAMAAVTGFGIGSILTPALAARVGMKSAVAAISIPHVLGTGVRFWTLRGRVNRKVLWGFGIMSAAGGLIGALLHEKLNNPVLIAVFGGLLVFAGLTGVTSLAARMRFAGPLAWVAGGVSGFLGGLVGNQGGIRSAAMLGFEIPRQEFVATATAIALFVDAARVPVYVSNEHRQMTAVWLWLVVATAGVLVGTLLGLGALRHVSEKRFRQVVSFVIFALGVYMLLQLR